MLRQFNLTITVSKICGDELNKRFIEDNKSLFDEDPNHYLKDKYLGKNFELHISYENENNLKSWHSAAFYEFKKEPKNDEIGSKIGEFLARIKDNDKA